MSNFIDLEVVPTDYSGYSIFSLLCSYWEICKELITIRELINIDHIRDISRISVCGQGLRNIESVLQEKWTSNLPPLYIVLLKYSQNKFIYNPKRFEKREYFSFSLLSLMNAYYECKALCKERSLVISTFFCEQSIFCVGNVT